MDEGVSMLDVFKEVLRVLTKTDREANGATTTNT